MKVKDLILTALFAALTAIGAFLGFKFVLASITLQFLFTAMAGVLLGRRYGALSQAVYVLLGLVGVPIFAQGGGFLPLYDESLPLPRLLLPPEVEARLPEGLDRGQLLSVLWRTGALRPGQVSVQLGETENKGAVPEIRAFCP